MQQGRGAKLSDCPVVNSNIGVSSPSAAARTATDVSDSRRPVEPVERRRQRRRLALLRKTWGGGEVNSPSGVGLRRASHLNVPKATCVDRVRKVTYFPFFLNLELLFCEIFDCKE